MMLGDVLDRKEAFQDNKNMILYVQKIGNFPKGLTHDFGQKLKLSSWFVFLLKIGPQMMFGYVLDRKEVFLEDKKMYLICNP